MIKQHLVSSLPRPIVMHMHAIGSPLPGLTSCTYPLISANSLKFRYRTSSESANSGKPRRPCPHAFPCRPSHEATRDSVQRPTTCSWPVAESMDESSSSGSSQSRQLPVALQLHILSLLPRNERALSSRFVCREAADALSEPQHCTASLSQPLPPHAVTWAQEAGHDYMRQLPFHHKPLVLCAAATSGSEDNLEVAWALLQPSIFPDPPESWAPFRNCYHKLANPGVAAVEAGHPQLLGWLMRHCPALLRPEAVLQAAVEHCDLAGLQGVCEVVGRAVGSSHVDHDRTWQQAALDAAAKSTAPDAVAKMEWILREAGRCCVDLITIQAAACSGDPARLQWLKDSGRLALYAQYCPHTRLPDQVVQEARLEMVQWLVDEAGWQLPETGPGGDELWPSFLEAAARSADGVAKLQWLQERGAPPLAASLDMLQLVALDALQTGQLEVLRYLLSVSGPVAVLQMGSEWLGNKAAGSGSMAIVALLHQAGLVFDSEAYHGAATAGSVNILRWLAVDLRVPGVRFTLHDVIKSWPRRTPHDSRCLVEAVALLVSTVCQDWNACPARDALARNLAAGRGDLALMRYLEGLPPPPQQQQQQDGEQPEQQHGEQPEQQPACWPNGETLVEMVVGGCEVLLDSLVDHPSITCGPVRACPYLVAGKRGDRATLAALRRLEVPWGAQDVMLKAMKEDCSAGVLRWLAEQGAPVGDRDAMRKAVGTRWSRRCTVGAWLLRLAGCEEDPWPEVTWQQVLAELMAR